MTIGPVEPGEARPLIASSDVGREIDEWLSRAEAGDDVYYFAIRLRGELVGQIFLHDVNAVPGEALVGYHLFKPEYRGRGIGTAALSLLQAFVRAHTPLSRLIIITSEDNAASQGIARKSTSGSGFATA